MTSRARQAMIDRVVMMLGHSDADHPPELRRARWFSHTPPALIAIDWPMATQAADWLALPIARMSALARTVGLRWSYAAAVRRCDGRVWRLFDDIDSAAQGSPPPSECDFGPVPVEWDDAELTHIGFSVLMTSLDTAAERSLLAGRIDQPTEPVWPEARATTIANAAITAFMRREHETAP